MAKLIVVGPARVDDRLAAIVESELNDLVEKKGVKVKEVITNGAPGVALLAEQWAARKGLGVRSYRLHRELVDEVGRKVRDYRDRLMVRDADTVLIFNDFEGGSGADNVLRYAKKQNLHLRVVAC